jgi:predicted ATPase
LQQLLDYLYGKRLLLLLDNFEHLLDGSDLVGKILRGATGVAILATSRERLNLREEHLYPIQGLELPEEALLVEPSQESTVRYASVQLFLDGAGRTQPGFRLTPDNAGYVARLCRLVEGMPLGIELAASWADLLSLKEIGAEIQANLDFLETDMRDVPDRHRSIRAVFETSWERLSQDEREVFARLSVFRGGFTRKAAQEVAGASLRQLARLSNKSLLQYRKSRDRYLVHELLRQYAAERLASDLSDKNDVRGRHSAYYCEALAALEPDLKGAKQQEAVSLIRADDQNVRAAWYWAVEKDRVGQIGRTIASLGMFYLLSDRYEEGEVASKEAAEKLANVEGAEGRLVLARLLTWQGGFKGLLGRRDLAGQLLTRALKLLGHSDVTGLDVRADVAFAEYILGVIVKVSEFQEARDRFEKSLAICRELGDQWAMGLVLQALGNVIHSLGEYEEGRRLLEEGLAVRRAIGDKEGTAETLGGLAYNAYYTGRYEEAERLARESLAVFESLGHRSGIALGLSRLGIALFYLNKFEEAHAVLEEALATYRELGERSVPPRAVVRVAMADVNLGRYDEGRAIAHEGLALAREAGEDYLEARALWILGLEALARGAYRQSRQILQESVARYRRIGDQSELGYAQAVLGMAERGLGHGGEARRLLLEVLRTVPAGDVNNLTWALPGAALLLADQGELIRAAELYGLVSQHFPHARPRQDVYLHYLAEVAAGLPPEEAEAAVERGRQLDPWKTAQALLKELPELGWEE